MYYDTDTPSGGNDARCYFYLMFTMRFMYSFGQGRKFYVYNSFICILYRVLQKKKPQINFWHSNIKICYLTNYDF